MFMTKTRHEQTLDHYRASNAAFSKEADDLRVMNARQAETIAELRQTIASMRDDYERGKKDRERRAQYKPGGAKAKGPGL